MSTEQIITKLAALRRPFEAHQISKLPKETRQQKEARDKDSRLAIRCAKCGGLHHKDTVHLDYVGHAALTDRLLEVDPFWQWEPVARNEDGTPKIVNASMWIRLTVCGVTREGFGHAEGKSGGDMIKEVIGDALRNAAMRFGCALDLWHKGDLHIDQDAETAPKPQQAKSELKPAAQAKAEPITAQEAQGILETFKTRAQESQTMDDLVAWYKAAYTATAAHPDIQTEVVKVKDQYKSFLSSPFDGAPK